MSYTMPKEERDSLLKALQHFEDPHELTKLAMTKYNRFKVGFPADAFGKGIAHVFFTKPMLNLENNKADEVERSHSTDGLTNMERLNMYSSPFRMISEIWNTRFKGINGADGVPEILRSLSASPYDPINWLLSNRVQSFDMPDISLKMIEKGETFKGWKMPFATHMVDSKCSYGFSCQFEEGEDMLVYWTLKLWLEYMEKISMGIIKPSAAMREMRMIDYMASAYYFVLGPEGNEIKFWGRYTGIFPTNLPSSAFNYSGGAVQAPKYNVNFQATFVEEMDVALLGEFNRIQYGLQKTTRGIRANDALGFVRSDTWVGKPYVHYNPENGKYYLYFDMDSAYTGTAKYKPEKISDADWAKIMEADAKTQAEINRLLNDDNIRE